MCAILLHSHGCASFAKKGDKMPYSEPTNLAVVACPGGESFADEVITHLRNIYKHRFTLRNDTISRRYQIDKNELIKQINFESDINTSSIAMRNEIDKYRPPVFKVKARFTYFMNGEFKTELLECVRGKDVFIFQDVENHEPIALNEGKNVMSLSVNDHVMSMLVTVDAVRQAGAQSVSLVVPAFPYSRQRQKERPRKPYGEHARPHLRTSRCKANHHARHSLARNHKRVQHDFIGKLACELSDNPRTREVARPHRKDRRFGRGIARHWRGGQKQILRFRT